MDSLNLRPDSAAASRPSSAVNNLGNSFNSLMSPSDIVGPSPVTSVGTEVTEIEDDMSEEVRSQSTVFTEPHAQVHCLVPIYQIKL